MVTRQQCAFVQFTSRSSSEAAAEASFNKLILMGRRLNIKWGRSQAPGQITGKKEDEDDDAAQLEPVPGLPGGKELLGLTHWTLVIPYGIIELQLDGTESLPESRLNNHL